MQEGQFNAAVVPEKPNEGRPETIRGPSTSPENHSTLQGQEPTKPKIPETLSPKEKKRIFAPAFAAMQVFAKEKSISLPEAESLLDRLLVVDNATFFKLSYEETGQDPTSDHYAYNLYNRIAVLNDEAISKMSEYKRVSKEDLLREIAVHELWHSVMYKELWISNPQKISGEGEKIIRRDGLWTKKPDKKSKIDDDVAWGLYHLNEGFTEYLTAETLRVSGNKPTAKLYLKERGVIDALIEAGLNEKDFIQAAFTKDGFKGIVEKLDTLLEWEELKRENAVFTPYRTALSYIAQGLMWDFEWDSYGARGTEKTKRFIRERTSNLNYKKRRGKSAA